MARRGRGPWPSASASSADRGGRERKRESRERDLIDSKFKIFSKLPFETLKILNMKVVENLKTYNFNFRKKFNRAKV